MKYTKIQQNDNLLRDMHSNAIINTDNRALQAYKNSKRKMQSIDEIKNENEAIKEKLIRLESKLDMLVDLLDCNK